MSEVCSLVVEANVSKQRAEVTTVLTTLSDIIGCLNNSLHCSALRLPPNATETTLVKPYVPLDSYLQSPLPVSGSVLVDCADIGNAAFLMVVDPYRCLYTAIVDPGAGDVYLLQSRLNGRGHIRSIDRATLAYWFGPVSKLIDTLKAAPHTSINNTLEQVEGVITSRIKVNRAEELPDAVNQFVLMTDFFLTFPASSVLPGRNLEEKRFMEIFPLESEVTVMSGLRCIDGYSIPFMTVVWNLGENTVVTFIECNQDGTIVATQWQMSADQQAQAVLHNFTPEELPGFRMLFDQLVRSKYIS